MAPTWTTQFVLRDIHFTRQYITTRAGWCQDRACLKSRKSPLPQEFPSNPLHFPSPSVKIVHGNIYAAGRKVFAPPCGPVRVQSHSAQRIIAPIGIIPGSALDCKAGRGFYCARVKSGAELSKLGAAYMFPAGPRGRG